MKIGIDARFAVHNRRGIGNYTLKLVQYLAAIDKETEYILYIDIDDSENILPKQDNFRVVKMSPSNYLIWEQIILPIRAQKDKLDILHCTGNTAPIWFGKNNRLLITIHDVMYLKSYSLLPQSLSMYQRWGRIYRKTIVPLAVRHASGVITVSGFSKNDILASLPKINEELILVTYEAAGERFGKTYPSSKSNPIAEKLGIRGDYIFTLGALDPRKNTKMVMDVFLALKTNQNIGENLVIAGIPRWRTSAFYQELQKSPFRNSVLFTDFVTEEELFGLYRGAKIFLYPSLYEGFGIPPLEAMASGAPVITSNVTSIPEIVGDAALLINPASNGELAAAMLSLLNNEGLRTSFIEKGFERAKQFSWLKMAKETLSIYESVYKHAKPAA